MADYNVISVKTNERRSFAITVGLQEGYGPTGRLHDHYGACDIIKKWIKERAAAGLTFIGGTLTDGDVIYGWLNDQEVAIANDEPVVVFSGEVSVIYNFDVSDGEIIGLLNDLAGRLGSELGQTRVYVTYRDKAWVLQAEGEKTPTGE